LSAAVQQQQQQQQTCNRLQPQTNCMIRIISSTAVFMSSVDLQWPPCAGAAVAPRPHWPGTLSRSPAAQLPFVSVPNWLHRSLQHSQLCTRYRPIWPSTPC
jgi:hypothetical protein